MKDIVGICPYCGARSEMDLLYNGAGSSGIVYLECGHEVHSNAKETVYKDAKTKEVLPSK